MTNVAMTNEGTGSQAGALLRLNRTPVVRQGKIGNVWTGGLCVRYSR